MITHNPSPLVPGRADGQASIYNGSQSINLIFTNYFMSKFLIIIDGLNGAGKSTIARQLHAKLPFTAFIHWDTIKKIISDFEPTQLYHGIAAKVVTSMIKTYLENGVNVVYEAYFGKKEFIENVAKLAEGDIKLLVYQIEAPFETRKEKIKSRFEKGETKKLLPDEHIDRNDKFYYENKYQGAKVFDSSRSSPDEIVCAIIEDLK